MGAGRADHADVRGRQRAADEREQLLVAEAEPAGLLGPALQQHIRADPPGQQHLIHRDTQPGLRVPYLFEDPGLPR
jgi:hypothetical protein